MKIKKLSEVDFTSGNIEDVNKKVFMNAEGAIALLTEIMEHSPRIKSKDHETFAAMNLGTISQFMNKENKSLIFPPHSGPTVKSKELTEEMAAITKAYWKPRWDILNKRSISAYQVAYLMIFAIESSLGAFNE